MYISNVTILMNNIVSFRKIMKKKEFEIIWEINVKTVTLLSLGYIERIFVI